MTGTTFETHEVVNQPPPPSPRNLYETDPILIGALEPLLDEPSETALSDYGKFWGSVEARELGRMANLNLPGLKPTDPFGHRIDLVEYHPAYHALMRRGATAGLAVSLWDEEEETDRGRRHALRTARLFMAAEVESGHLFQLCTTSAALSALTAGGDLGTEWLARALPRRYDHRFMPAADKTGVTIGLGFTEKQGTLPIADPTTRAAQATEDDGGGWTVTGHKWFLSAPQSDAFLIAAIVATPPADPDGLDAPPAPQRGARLFLVPRHRSDGSVNAIRFMRLKDKLGNRSNATAEAEFADAEAFPVGEADAAADAIATVLQHIRFDAAIMAAGSMRGALASAVHHARHRGLAEEVLLDQPLMARVLADMTLDAAAATALIVRIAHALDRAGDDEGEAAYARLVIPAAKYWIAKTAVAISAEALECLGGNGYVEDHDLARPYRDTPGWSLWGGPGNVLALDVLKTVEDSPEAFEAAVGEIAIDLDRQASTSADLIREAAQACIADQGSARILVEQIALTAAAAAMHRFAPRPITDAFVDTRLSGPWRASYGMLDSRFDARGIVDFAFPTP